VTYIWLDCRTYLVKSEDTTLLHPASENTNERPSLGVYRHRCPSRFHNSEHCRAKYVRYQDRTEQRGLVQHAYNSSIYYVLCKVVHIVQQQ